jgi:energy-coupling factor transport system ATP-binding protein
VQDSRVAAIGHGAILCADDLGVRYPTRREPALRGVSFRVAPGERVLVAGPSGGGKSTLALCLAGLIPHSVAADVTGTVAVAGTATGAYPPGALAEQVGVVFQDPSSQFTMLSVDDEVAFGLENLGVPRAEMPARVMQALAVVGLEDRAAWRIDRLSGGQQQRVALAAALAMRPRVLILDEPAALLDPRGAAEVYRHLARIARAGDTTLVMVEHDLDKVVPGLAERCLLLDATGAPVGDGTTEETFAQAASAQRCADLGVRLPAPVALALALGGSDERLPLDVDAAADWLLARRQAQQVLRDAVLQPRPTPGERVVLRARDLWHRYAGPASSYQALRGISLDLHEAELVAVVGANGCGKTTLLRALSGLLRLERGTVAVDGVDLAATGAYAAARLVAHVFQNPESGFVAATVADEVAYGPRRLGWSQAEVAPHADAALARFGLTALARANPFTLSQGQKRRLSVAVALTLGPRVLVLDEPTFGQDGRSALALMDEIAALCDQGLAVVVATHDLGLVAETADRVVALCDGRVVCDGTPSGFLADGDLLALTRQEEPPLARVLAAARRLGADVPPVLRWRDLAALCAAVQSTA